MKKVIILFLCLIPFIQSSSQQTGIWKNYTNFQSIADAYTNQHGIWTATSGGAFYYDLTSGNYETLTKAEGLGNNILTSIAADKNGRIWFGSQNGIIDVYDPQSHTFVKEILDIYNSSKTSKQINDIVTSGDTAFVSTDFGLSLININTFFFYDTYIKFGSFTSDSKVTSTFKNKLLFIASENGIAKQKEGAVNLSAPEAWENYTTLEGLPSNTIYKFIKYRDTLLVSTNKGLAVFNKISWQKFLPQLSKLSISDLQVRNDSLFILANDSIFIYYKGKLSLNYSSLPSVNGLVLSGNKIYTYGTKGLSLLNSSSVEKYFIPNGPSSNFFYGTAVDKNGNLWAGSGSSALATGFYKYDGSKWTNYTKDSIPNGNFNQIFKTYVDPDNTVYLLSWGDGFTRYKDKKFKIFNAYNTDLCGITKNIKYVVIQGLANDSKGNLWILTYGSANKQPLAVLKTDSTWQYYTNVLTNKVILGYDLAVDSYDTKWMVIGDAESTGGQAIYYFNSSSPIYSSDTDGWGSISSSDGLNSTTVNSVAIDRRGELWIGTSEGINIISDTRRPRSLTSSSLLRTQIINDIAVDALNQKWIATQQGVFVISSDGASILASYNSSNSPLPDNSIRNISIDNNTGTVYFGTDFGLASLTTSSIYPKDNFSDIIVSPNPVVINNGKSVNIIIDGLIRDTDIKILTITGKMVTTFSSPGGRTASWNGKDSDGNYVSSGVYLIVAYDKEGNNVGIGKVAVIKN